MRKLLALTLLGAAATWAVANVQIFFTGAAPNPWAGTGPASIFAPTAGNHLDFSQDGYTPNYANFPTAYNPTQTVDPGQTAYMWIKFNVDTQVGPVLFAKMQGLDLNMAAHGGAGSDIAWYLQDDTGAGNPKRWDGDVTPGAPEFKKWHQVLVAVTGNGIKIKNANDDFGMFHGTTGGPYVALLGAVKIDTGGDFTFALGTLGINFNTGPSAPPVQFGTLHVTPEPAAAVLLALAGLLIRRR